MDLVEFGDGGSGCEGEDCGLVSGFTEDCSNHTCQWEEPAVFGLIELVCVTVIYIPLMIVGLLGNILTILVVWLRPHMRSSTYLYLSSMAVSDLLILLLLPLELYKLWKPRPWPLGDFACKLTIFLSECCTFCTILHITFLSMERYLAVCWPITAKTLVTRRRTKALIGCLWLVAALSAAPVFLIVGVEDVEVQELGLGEWREDGGWASFEEQGGFIIGEKEQEDDHMGAMDGGLEKVGWGEGKQGMGEKLEREQEDGGRPKEVGDEEKKELEGEPRNKMREDEGGGRGEGGDGGWGRDTDKRECRCTEYAVSSGLLSAMMILSNLYFLVPLCILALVYSLIGRTLWLRPQSSRRDQSHRHTIKMLGVIVLAFVLCWLPFHVGRTIFFLHQSMSSEPEAYTHFEMNTPPESIEGNGHVQTVAELSDVDAETTSLDVCAKTKVKINKGPRTHFLNDTEMHNHRVQCDKRLARFPNMSSGNKTPETSTVIPHGVSVQNTGFLTKMHTVTDMQGSGGTKNPPAIRGMNVYASATPDPRADAVFNGTHPDPDAHFWYFLSQYVNLVSSVLFFLSAAINPLLYNLMSARYRQAVQSLVRSHSHTQPHRLGTLTTRHSTTTL